MSVTSEAQNDFAFQTAVDLDPQQMPTDNTNAVLVHPGDIVQMDSNDTSGGTVGHWYQYLGTANTYINLALTNFADATQWKDEGLMGASMPDFTTSQTGANAELLQPYNIVQDDSNNTSGTQGNWYLYLGPAATIDLTATNFSDANLWQSVGIGNASLPTLETSEVTPVNNGDTVESAPITPATARSAIGTSTRAVPPISI